MTLPDVVIRARTDADLHACEEMLLAVHAADGYPVNLPEHPASFLDLPGLLGAWVAASEPDGALVGHVALRPHTSTAVLAVAVAATGLAIERFAVVARLLVAPAARGRGIGRALLDAAVARAWELGCQPVLDVVAGSAPAIALYEGAGWQRCGETRVTYGALAFDLLVYVGPGPPGGAGPAAGAGPGHADAGAH